MEDFPKGYVSCTSRSTRSVDAAAKQRGCGDEATIKLRAPRPGLVHRYHSCSGHSPAESSTPLYHPQLWRPPCARPCTPPSSPMFVNSPVEKSVLRGRRCGERLQRARTFRNCCFLSSVLEHAQCHLHTKSSDESYTEKNQCNFV